MPRWHAVEIFLKYMNVFHFWYQGMLFRRVKYAFFCCFEVMKRKAKIEVKRQRSSALGNYTASSHFLRGTVPCFTLLDGCGTPGRQGLAS